MQNRIVLISDDSDFFQYVTPFLSLRKSDELILFSFDEVTDKIFLLESSLIIINSESSKEKTIELLELMRDLPVIIFSYNYNEEYAIKLYKKGALDYISVGSSEEEIRAKLLSAMSTTSNINKSNLYRQILVKNNLLTKNNEVFSDYCSILDNEIEQVGKTASSAVLAAISPNDKTKFLLSPNQIETIILNNVRKDDILMSYAANKYFLFLHNADINSAEKIWEKIKRSIPEKIFAGFAMTGKKNRQQLVNEALNRLHEAINKEDFSSQTISSYPSATNFKLYRNEFNKKIENVILPVFYLFEQKYNNKFMDMNIKQSTGDGYGLLTISNKKASGLFKISSPGLTKVLIDIYYQPISSNIAHITGFPQSKRISLEPDELEEGLLEDLLEQFIIEFKSEVNNECIK